MRICIIPDNSIKNIWSSSSYLAMEDFMINNPNNYYYLFVDNVTKEQYEKRIEEKEFNNVHISTYDWYVTDFYNNVLSFDFRALSENFSNMFWKYPVDLFFGASPYFAFLIKKYASDIRRFYNDVLYFNFEQKTLDAKTDKMPRYEYISYNLWHVVWHTIFLWELDKKLALKELLKIFNWEALKKFHENSTVIPMWVNCDFIDEILKDNVKNSNNTMFYWWRINTAKRVDQTFQEYFYLYAEWSWKYDIEITTWSQFNKTLWNIESVAKLHKNVNREEYLKIACKCHCCLSFSPIESFGVWRLEMLYCWVIIILPDKERVWNFFWKWQYPFLYKNLDEARFMLRDIMENYEESWKKIEWIREYIKEKFDIKKISSIYQEYFLSKVEKNRLNAIRSNKPCNKLLSDAFELIKDREIISFWQLVSVMQKISPTFDLSNSPRWKSYSQWELYSNAISQWAIDLCNAPYPNFINPKFVK